MAIKTITKEEDFFNRVNNFKIKIIPMTDEQRKECIEEWNNFVVEFNGLDKKNYYCRVIQEVMQQIESKMLGNKQVEKEQEPQEDSSSIKEEPISVGEPKNEVLKDLTIKTPEVENFYQTLISIDKKIKDIKQKDPNYIYSDINEFNELILRFNALNTEDQDCIDLMRILENDINIVIDKKNKNSNISDNLVSRSPEVEDFYQTLISIDKRIKDVKQKDPNYIYSDVNEFNELIYRFNALNTEDQNCIDLMRVLETDINLAIERIKESKVTIKNSDTMSPVSSELSPIEIYSNKVSGIISWLNEEKNNNPEFRYDNEEEFIGLLKEAGALNITDPDILDMLITLSEDLHGDIIEQQQNGFGWMK